MMGLQRAALAALRLMHSLTLKSRDSECELDTQSVADALKDHFLVDETFGAPPELQMLNEITISRPV